jgi:NADH:ubiquinone oxidoreductase subunit 6 (subunit J)
MKTMLKRYRRSLELALFQVTFVPITPPNSSGDSLVSGLFGSSGGGMNLGDMLNVAFQVAINVGAILAMMRIMWAGWLYMGSADMWSNKHHAKEVFQDAIIGLLILLAIWIILNQINPQILNPGTLGSTATS